jgi:uncharacterized glyoxalase superfamily protein PhnB
MSEITAFTSEQSNLSMPAATVIPVLLYPDVPRAVVWLCGAFGFVERLRIGAHRVQLSVGGGSIVIAQGPMRAAGVDSSHSVMVRVSNVDQHFAVAKAEGAHVSGEPMSLPYGERQYSALDLAGHAWTFSQTEANVDPSLWGGQLVREGQNAA